MALPVRVAVINDYALVVAGTARVLEQFRDRVEVVELDSSMPVVSDVDVVLFDAFGQAQGPGIDPHVLMEGGQARLVVFSWNSDPGQVQSAIERGAAGFVAKSATGLELVEAIERVARGERVVPDPASGPGAREGGSEAESEAEEPHYRWPGDDHGLSSRESEVLALICQGLSNSDIAGQIYIGINTVKTYIRSLYRKIGATTRPQAVIWGMQHGFEPDHLRKVGSSPADEVAGPGPSGVAS